MAPSRTRFIGMDVHKDAIAVASGAQDQGAEVTYRGTIGTRQGDIDHLIRKMPSKAQHLIFVYAAGPWGDWLSRYPAQVSRHGQRRLAHHPNVSQDIRWKAPGRLWQRYRRLLARGQHPHMVTVTMARELAGCMWAMAKEVPVIASDQDGS